MFISDEAENFGDIQHFCITENNWLLYILSWPIQKSSEKLMFSTRKAMYNCVNGNLNSEQLVLGQQ